MKHVLHRHQLTRVLGCWLLAAFSQWASAQSALEDATVVDAIVKQFIAGLAKDQRFTLLTSPNPGDAQPGSLYSVKEPESCPSDLRRATLNGEAVDISRWQDLPPPLGGGESKVLITGWRSVRIDAFIGNAAKVALAKRTGKTAAEIDAAVRSLSESKAQVNFGKHEQASFPLRQAAEQYLRDKGITSAAQTSPESKGIVVPYAQLVFQKFVFDSESVRAIDVNLAAKFFNLFKLKVEGDRTQVRGSRFVLPTNAVFAFKYEPLLFTCP